MLQKFLVCPVSHGPLEEVHRDRVREVLGDNLCRVDINRATVVQKDIAETFLLHSHGKGAYPIVDGIPILMAPEMLVSCESARNGSITAINTNEDPYREAYAEMHFYNTEAKSSGSDITSSGSYKSLEPLVGISNFPSAAWLDAAYDNASQADAYGFISPIGGKEVLQLGGSGLHAVKFLLAGASRAWLMTPMLGEATLGRELARAFGVEDKFRAVVGIAEQMPFADASFDGIYSGGCIHHTVTKRAFPEINRVLNSGGRFAAVEPWRAPLYRLGSQVFGKREAPVFGKRDCGVVCNPMEQTRADPLFHTFANAQVRHHGTFTRYALIALGKLGARPRQATIDRITRIDDRIASKTSLRKYGSSVALLAESSR
jgi:uncharacterized protein YbaR (Trm112 family)/SAM-dependent methyltransferase